MGYVLHVRGNSGTGLTMTAHASRKLPQAVDAVQLVKRDNVPLRWTSPAELQGSYTFDSLRSFLPLDFEGCKVLVTRRDVTFAFLERPRVASCH